jgi:hypothetical protein
VCVEQPAKKRQEFDGDRPHARRGELEKAKARKHTRGRWEDEEREVHARCVRRKDGGTG